MTVTASILSYNSHATLPRVVDGIESQTRPPDRIIIVDNGSQDDTRQFLKQLPPRYEVIYLPENAGLGAGHNTGWRAALEDPDCEYVWTLENDSIPPANLLDRLLGVASRLEENGTSFGAVSPRETHPDYPSNPPSQDLRTVEWLTFNGTLIPRSSISTVGLLREDFFIDQDDWEFAGRLVGAGLPIYYDPGSVITHLGRGKHERGFRSTLRLYYRVRNATYMRKYVQERPLASAESVARAGAAIVRTLLTEPDKRLRVTARIVATRDGLKADLGKKEYPFLSG